MDYLECKICMEQYNKEERCPRCLSCGHTLCTTCLAGMISRGPLDCPFCRTKHISLVSSAKDVPVNFTVVNILEETSVAKTAEESPALLAEVKKQVSGLIASQLVSTNSCITKLKDFEQCCAEEQRVLECNAQSLKSLIKKNEDLLQDMSNAENCVATAVVKGVETYLFMEAQQTRLMAATSLLEVTAVLQGDGSSDVQEWSVAAHQLLQSQFLSTANKMKLEISTTLEALMGGNMNDMTVTPKKKRKVAPHTLWSPCQLAFTPQNQMEGSVPPMARLLLEMIKRARETGSEVWSVTEMEGQPHYAEIVQMDKHVYLSTLKKGDPPDHIHTLNYNAVRGLVDETCMRIYLELFWAGQVQGRVHIKLLKTGPSTQQFSFLCSGECGQSYANTCLLSVESRGKHDERVWGGDYEKNNGSGGAALLGLRMGCLTVKRVVAGLVGGFSYSNPYHKPAHFVIYNYDCPDKYEVGSIGNVERGIEVVRMAAKLTNIKEAIVSDCGIVLFEVP